MVVDILQRKIEAYHKRPGWNPNDPHNEISLYCTGGPLKGWSSDFGWRVSEQEGNRRRQAALIRYDCKYFKRRSEHRVMEAL